jgi:hypothetical protein
MRHVILATAAAVMLSGAVSAREPGMEIAMGPTSAAHFPINQPRSNPAPDCSLPYDQCPKAHGTPKYLHRAPKHRRHDHSGDYSANAIA